MLDVDLVKALANDKRLLILEWLRDAERHFPPQRDGDLVRDGVCSLYIADKLEVKQILDVISEFGGKISAEPPRLDGILGLKGVLDVELPKLDESETAKRTEVLQRGFAQAIDGLSENDFICAAKIDALFTL